MTRVRIALLAIVACMAIGGAVVPGALAASGAQKSSSAQTVAPLYKMHVNGVSKTGKKFTGTYSIQRFVVAKVNGKRGVFSTGTLKGTFEGRHITRNNVMLPAKLTGGTTTPGTTTASRDSTRQATSCTILNLVLAPINLNLLGLQVTLAGGSLTNQQPIILNLTANSGQGLLGSLLCGIDNALGSSTVLSQLNTQLNNLSSALNGIVSLLAGL